MNDQKSIGVILIAFLILGWLMGWKYISGVWLKGIEFLRPVEKLAEKQIWSYSWSFFWKKRYDDSSTLYWYNCGLHWDYKDCYIIVESKKFENRIEASDFQIKIIWNNRVLVTTSFGDGASQSLDYSLYEENGNFICKTGIYNDGYWIKKIIQKKWLLDCSELGIEIEDISNKNIKNAQNVPNCSELDSSSLLQCKQ